MTLEQIVEAIKTYSTSLSPSESMQELESINRAKVALTDLEKALIDEYKTLEGYFKGREIILLSDPDRTCFIFESTYHDNGNFWIVTTDLNKKGEMPKRAINAHYSWSYNVEFV